MKCPHCDKEILGISCPQCDAVTPEGAKYCMKCGSYLGEQVEDFSESGDGLDFEDRVLCPDGTCTGIMVDGRCSECGKTLGDEEKVA